MNEKEIGNLKDYVKKRYDKANLDYMSFDQDIDSTLTYSEQKEIVDEYLSVVLQKVAPPTRQEAIEVREAQEVLQKEEMEKLEVQAKIKFEEQLDKIANTPKSVLLDKLYFVPRAYIKMVIEKRVKGLMLYGSGGLGKTFCVKKELTDAKLKEGDDFLFICGHVSPMSFFKKLYQNKDKIICVDDLDILESGINLDMLKALLSDGIVEYSSPVLKDVPSQFSFSGSIIILLNEKPKNSEHLKAVESRILTYELEMDYETKMSVIYDISKLDYDGISMKERQKIAEWIKNSTSKATKNLSIRLLFMCFEFYKFDRANWEILAGAYIQNDEYVSLILRGCSDSEFCQRTGLSRRTYYNLKREAGLSRSYNL